MTDEVTLARRVAKSILYEDYLLYPYRPAAREQKRRLDFGVLYPADNCLDEPAAFHLEALARCPRDDDVQVIIRFLHLFSDDEQPGVQQGREREFSMCMDVAGSIELPVSRPFQFPDGKAHEPGSQEAIRGEVAVTTKAVDSEVYRFIVQVSNLTTDAGLPRAESLRHSMICAHAILALAEGTFLSLTEPPEGYRDAADECKNRGVWPALTGRSGSSRLLLALPIVLPDYPEFARESVEDYIDATGTGDTPAPRLQTQSSAEKEETLASAPRARETLGRVGRISNRAMVQIKEAVRARRRAAQP